MFLMNQQVLNKETILLILQIYTDGFKVRYVWVSL